MFDFNTACEMIKSRRIKAKIDLEKQHINFTEFSDFNDFTEMIFRKRFEMISAEAFIQDKVMLPVPDMLTVTRIIPVVAIKSLKQIIFCPDTYRFTYGQQTFVAKNWTELKTLFAAHTAN